MRISIVAALAVVLIPCHVAAQSRVFGWGDSLTRGMDWGAWIERWHPDRWDVRDHGWNGEQSWRAACNVALPKPDCRFRDFLSSYSYEDGDTFVFLWGTNDVRYFSWTDPDSPWPDASATRAALEQMVDDALATGADVVVGVPPPLLAFEGSTHSAEEVSEFNRRISVTLRGIVQAIVRERPGVQLFDAYEHWIGLPGWPDPDYYRRGGLGDGIHPGGGVDTPTGRPGTYHVAEAVEQGLLGTLPPAAPIPAPILLPDERSSR